MEIEPDVFPAVRSEVAPSTDQLIARLARRQKGTVARRQLLALGVTTKEIEWRVRTGRLHVLHRGVYAVGHTALSRDGELLAAVLAAGPGAVLSHRSAAELHRIAKRRPGPIHTTTPKQRRPQKGLSVTAAFLRPDEQETVRGIPVTTVARTLLDLAAVSTEAELERAVREAEVNQLADETSLHALIARHPRRRGIATLKRLIDADDLDVITKSELEDRFRKFLRRTRLPPPVHNTVVATFMVDALWRDQRLVAELDGFRTHGRRRSFEDDRRRDRILQAAGYRVIRITWRQLRDEPDAVARDLRALLP